LTVKNHSLLESVGSRLKGRNSPRLWATLIGGSAVLLWSTLALLTTLSGHVPPFQLMAMAFALGFLPAAAEWIFPREPSRRHLRQPVSAWLIGVGGLFGFHFFYFIALRHAPAVESSLLSYLWPLLLVVFSAFLPGERLRWWHVAGVSLGLCGTILLVTRGGAFHFQAEYLPGYAAALACALTWSTYSLLNRQHKDVPTGLVGGFCGATAVLALICHWLFETTVWPQGSEWLAILGLGLGPVGAAFYAWDYGTKHGDIRILGSLSYAAPLLSTCLLVAFGKAALTWIIGGACLLIVAGALLASKELLQRRL
jgi:drug/metabolite transporter (DMT)-like permease